MPPRRLCSNRCRPTLLLQSSGFTLIELAISMFIITLIATVLIGPITAQVTQAKISQAKADLDQINESLIGFALAQGKPRLPCPDTNGDGTDDGCASTNANETTGGNIPWATLGVPATDPWGQRYRYRVNNAYTNVAAGFTLSTTPTGPACDPAAIVATGFLKVCATATCLTPPLPLPVLSTVLANGVPAIIYSLGPNGAIASTSPDEIENTNGDCLFISRTYSSGSGSEFDDLVVWVSPSVLLSRMVTAQKLPN